MAVKPIEEVLADTLERIATALEELVEVQRTEPLSKIIHPSMRRPTVEELVTDGDEK
jgi:hypothetical protein